jgi:hypothetical protein
MTSNTEAKPKSGNKRGRPPGPSSKKVRLRPDSKTSKERYYKMYGELGVCCVYGIDEYTDDLIEYLWNKPDVSFVVTDPIEATLALATKKYGGRSFSMYRWDAVHHQGFIEEAQGLVVVVAKRYYEDVKVLPNPDNVKLVVLEELS